ncbi:MAG: O-antigen ligase family protein [Gammaproteobacteria bacterium]|nr:O-antigen ligase family protein [Gammaproteobacteria bacterium]
MPLAAIAFALSYLGGLLLAFVSHPRWGLFTYLGAFYLHPPYRWWGTALPEFRWSLVAAVVTALSMSGAKLPPNVKPWSSHTLSKIVMLYVLYMWIQTAWANPRHLEGVILLTKYVVMFYVIYRLITDQKGLVDFALAHVAGCLYFGILALEARGGGRLEYIGGPGANDSNTLGMHMSTGLIFAASLIISQRGWKRWAVLAAVPFMANCVVQAQSRGAFLGAAVGGMVYFFMAPKAYRKYFVMLGLVGVMVLAARAPAEFWERMGTIKTSHDETKIDHSAESRLVLARAQLQMFLEHPMGLGFDTTSYLSRNYLAVEWLTAMPGVDVATHGVRGSHNTVLTVLVDQGVPGITLLFIGLVSVAGTMMRLKRLPANGPNATLALMNAAICGSLVVVAVSGLFTNYLKAEVQLWLIALLVASSEMVRLADRAPALESQRPAELEPSPLHRLN